MAVPSRMIGARIQRREDPRLITGHGRYVDDLAPAGLLHMAVVRSPYAHATIRVIEATAARSMPGVEAVLLEPDFKAVLSGYLPVGTAGVPLKKQSPEQFPMASGEAVYEGEPIAVVLAKHRYQASDAAAALVRDIDFEVLPAVIDLEKALEAGGPTVHRDAPDNVSWDVQFHGGDIAAAFAEAEITLRQRILQQRLVPMPLEGRAVLAQWDPFDGALTMWTSSQVPHFIRLFIARALGIGENQIRVIAPDVGGAFGSKIRPYPEEYLAAACTKLLGGRPVKWSESRSENFRATNHGRGHIFDIEVAARLDGTLLGLKIEQMTDVGAYVGLFGSNGTIAIQMGGGCYRWKAVDGRSIGVLTNKMSTDPYRGAGRPEAAHLCERAVDLIALELGMDPADVRRKNFAHDFPFSNNFGFLYDSGDYQKALDLALEIAGYEDFRREQAEARTKGRFLGIGMASYVEICGFGPAAATASPSEIGLVESATVRIHPTGVVDVNVGTHSHGQGHVTSFAQIVSDTLFTSMDSVRIHFGDTANTPFGYGTYGSRSVAVGGMAILRSCQKVVRKARQIAAHVFEAAEEDILVGPAGYYVKGDPGHAKGLSEIAFAAYGGALPEGMEQGLEAVTYFDPPNFTWPFGTHVCIVEIDPETGAVELKKYVAVDDCGNVINPMIVEGQIQGGIAQGIAQALFEEVVYDEATGQLMSGSLIDYLVPTANEIPDMQLDHTFTPSPTNELGVKGVGEAGTIGSSAAVINAICDALSPLGIKHVDMPASPNRLWRMIQDARSVTR
jgi:aerobic carbon-monoxide dehydrogenase large subunit